MTNIARAPSDPLSPEHAVGMAAMLPLRNGIRAMVRILEVRAVRKPRARVIPVAGDGETWVDLAELEA